jgi:hypothetical protein
LSKKTLNTILSWCGALVVALLLANGVSFFYRSGAGSIQRENAFSTSIRTPNSRIVRGAEGYGVNYVDENGYLNPRELQLGDEYILLLGSSHAEGLQVMQADNMAAALNRKLAGSGQIVYNLGTAGYTLPQIIKGFHAALEEFPNASAVLIETGVIAYSKETLQDALNQTTFDKASTGQALVASQGMSRRVRNAVLEVAPIISLLRAQFELLSFDFEGAFGIDLALFTKQESAALEDRAQSAASETAKEITAADEIKAAAKAAYYDVLNQVFALLRSEFDKPIILLYHPALRLQGDGVMQIRREEGPYDAYLAACANNDIVFVDTGDAFLAAYAADYTVPYGFQNTTLGSGHLNAAGHEIAAEAFYQALMEYAERGKE